MKKQALAENGIDHQGEQIRFTEIIAERATHYPFPEGLSTPEDELQHYNAASALLHDAQVHAVIASALQVVVIRGGDPVDVMQTLEAAVAAFVTTFPDIDRQAARNIFQAHLLYLALAGDTEGEVVEDASGPTEVSERVADFGHRLRTTSFAYQHFLEQAGKVTGES